MASQFHVQLMMREAPGEAQARAATALTEPAKSVGLRLTGRGAGTLDYKPRVQFPFLLMLYHSLSGEKMSVNFTPGEGGGTNVSIDGRVAGGTVALASDPEHWSGPLGATVVS